MTIDTRSRARVTPARLRTPRAMPGLVGRDRLTEGMLGRRRVTLVCAPAGYGKSALVADWATRAAARGEPVAWLSLQPRDDGPAAFWSVLAEALAVAGSGAGRPPETLALTGPGSPWSVAGVVEAVLAAGVRWIVLDDMQLLHDEEVLRGLDLLLAELPPEVGMVLAGRSEPRLALHRLRLDGSLAEVGADELAFTAEEALEMFAAAEVPMTPAEIARLVVLTEGWAVALRTAVVAGGEDPAEVVSWFEGEGVARAVDAYIVAEIIGGLAPELVEFLHATCTPHRLPVELAAHLSGRADAGDLLERLCAANALVARVAGSVAYRYHPLLRGFLLTALARRDLDAPHRQHRAAAEWLDAHGEPESALHHAVLSRDEALLGDLLRANGLRLLLAGRGDLVRRAVAPEVALVNDRRVAVIAALAALDATDVTAADDWLEAVRAGGRPAEPKFAALLAAALVQRSLAGGDADAALEESAILDVTATGDADVDLVVLAQRGPARTHLGDHLGALDDLEQALALARSRGYDQVVIQTMSQLSGMTGALGDFATSRRWADRAISFATSHGRRGSPRLVHAYLVAAWTAFQTGDLRSQREYAAFGLRALRRLDNVGLGVEIGVRSMHALTAFETTTGPDRTAAAETLRRVLRLLRTDSAEQVSPALIAFATSQEVRLALAVGHADWADEAAARVRDRMPGSAESATLEAQLLGAAGRVRDALAELEPVLTGALPALVPTTVISARVLAAVLEASLDNDIRAFELLRKALERAVRTGYRRPFLDLWPHLEPLLSRNRSRFGPAEDFVTALLTDQARRGEHGPGTIGTLLSEREVEVLHDLPSRLTIPEIADAEGVSANTVKTHVRSIYQKLGVNTRSEAVRAAHERGLI